MRHCILASWCPMPDAQCPLSPLSSWPLHFPTLSSHFNEFIKAPVSSSTLSSYPLGFRPPAFPLTSVVCLFPVVSRSCITRPVNDPPVLAAPPVPACLPLLYPSIHACIYIHICNGYTYVYTCLPFFHPNIFSMQRISCL